MGVHANNRCARLQKTYAEGALHQQGGGLVGDNPWPAAFDEENKAWTTGFNDAASGTVDLSGSCNIVVPGAPPPEIGELRY